MSLGTRTHEGKVWTGYRRAETDRRVTELADNNTRGRVVDNTVRVYHRTPCKCKTCGKRFLAPSAHSRPGYCSKPCKAVAEHERDRRQRPWRHKDLKGVG